MSRFLAEHRDSTEQAISAETEISVAHYSLEISKILVKIDIRHSYTQASNVVTCINCFCVPFACCKFTDLLLYQLSDMYLRALSYRVFTFNSFLCRQPLFRLCQYVLCTPFSSLFVEMRVYRSQIKRVLVLDGGKKTRIYSNSFTSLGTYHSVPSYFQKMD